MTDPRLRKLHTVITAYGKALVAFSGGADSSLLLKVCVDVLGAGKVLAVTAASETYTSEELVHAEKFAKKLGVEHVVSRTDELSNPEFSSNTPRRCYHCKSEFYGKVVELARMRRFAHILDGSNVDDQGDYRPGREAAIEHGVRSPLIEAGLGKNDVRELSKSLGLKTWDKPANPCLASRFPYGETITAEKLAMVEKAEAVLQKHGFRGARVRHHGRIARIEVAPEELERLVRGDVRVDISARLKKIGFTWVSADLDGYRMGSLNEALDDKSKIKKKHTKGGA